MTNRQYDQWLQMQLEPEMNIIAGRPLKVAHWPERPAPIEQDSRTWEEIESMEDAYLHSHGAG